MTPGPDRLPAPSVDQMTEGQRQALDEISSGPRGALIGPFAPLIQSPELMTRVQRTGEFLRFHSSLEPRLFEMSILLVARRWDQQFEWSFHQPLALAAGLSEEIVESIGAGVRPRTMDAQETLVWDVVSELELTKAITDDTFARAGELIGHVELVELVASLGYYTLLAMVMNVAQTPAPAEPALPRLGKDAT